MATLTLAAAMNRLDILQDRMKRRTAFVAEHCCRDGKIVDPHDGEGGSEVEIEKALQSFHDLHEEYLRIRSLINAKNAEIEITLQADEGDVKFEEKRTLKGWIDWDRHGRVLEESLWKSVKSSHAQLLNGLKQVVAREQRTATPAAEGAAVDARAVFSVPLGRADTELDRINTMHKMLDGEKATINATTTIEI